MYTYICIYMYIYTLVGVNNSRVQTGFMFVHIHQCIGPVFCNALYLIDS